MIISRGWAGIVAAGIVAASPVAGEPVAGRIDAKRIATVEAYLTREYKPKLPLIDRARVYQLVREGGRKIIRGTYARVDDGYPGCGLTYRGAVISCEARQYILGRRDALIIAQPIVPWSRGEYGTVLIDPVTYRVISANVL